MNPVYNTNLFKDISRKVDVGSVYRELDSLWRAGQFIPSPVRAMTRDLGVTDTESLYLILGWRESRLTYERG